MTIVKTNTPLDSWLGGGLPLGITVIAGPPGSGKTAFLRTVAAERADPSTPTACISYEQRYAGGFHVSDIEGVMEILQGMAPTPAILIDDVQSYEQRQIDQGIAARAKVWANILRDPKVREQSVVLGVQTRLGKEPNSLTHAVFFAADLILTTEVQASIKDGVLLRLTCVKNRWMSTRSMTPLLMAVVRDETGGWRGEAA